MNSLSLPGLSFPGLRLLSLAILWGHLIYQTHYQWGDESYYNFGWAVPVLALVLWGNRLGSEPLSAFGRPGQPARRGLAVGLLLAALVPVSILSEVNVFWRIPLFLHASLLLGISWIWMEDILGRDNRRFFAFPLIFALTMLPWPFRIEVIIISWFSEQVTQFTTLFLRLTGIQAVASGNIIRLGELIVGVDDACSGIRSFQCLLMITLFLGDFFFLSLVRRCLLLVCGFLLVFIFNSLRSITLSLSYFLVGESFYDTLHDPVGLVTFSGSLASVFFLTVILTQSKQQFQEAIWRQNWTRVFPPSNRASGNPAWVAASAGLILAVEGWFWLNADSHASLVRFQLTPVEGKFSQIEKLEIPEWIEEGLGYDFGDRYRALGPGRIQAELYYYGYTGENRMKSVSSYGHSPLICMEAVGAQLESIQEPMVLEKEGLPLVLQHYLFSSPGAKGFNPVHVFWTVTERSNRGIDPKELQSLGFAVQVRQAFLGRRDYARTVTLISLAGSEDSEAIREAVSYLVQSWFQPLSDNSVNP